MILKVQIHTLDHELEIELKQYGHLYRLLIIASKNKFHETPGKVWHGESGHRELVDAISRLAIQCYRFPHRPEQIAILDGMLVNIQYQNEETTFKLSIKEFETGSNEVLLMRSLLAFCKQLLHDDSFDRYAASVEAYLG
jgi:hypothetical protein